MSLGSCDVVGLEIFSFHGSVLDPDGHVSYPHNMRLDYQKEFAYVVRLAS